MRIRKTRHYRIYHEDEVPWDRVLEVVFTTKRQKVGKGLVRFVRRTAREEIYILAGYDPVEQELRIINAKRKKRR